MAKAQGRAFLRTDGGAKDIDRMVDREVALTFYPTSTQSDAPVEVAMRYFPEADEVRVIITQRLPDGTSVHHGETILHNKNPER